MGAIPGFHRAFQSLIEAVQWRGNTASLQDLKNLDPQRRWLNYPNQEYLIIATLEGEMLANIGDWIIKGVKGEIYPCKPDIFEATYEPVE